MKIKEWMSLVLFVGGVIGIGVLIGMMTPPGDWYAALQKPPLTPPNWLFPPVCTVLYLLIAIAGWRVWQQEGLSSLFSIWLLQMGLNFAWSPTVFAAQQLGIGLAIMVALLALIVLFIYPASLAERAPVRLVLCALCALGRLCHLSQRDALCDQSLEHFQAKWIPVHRPEMRQIRYLEHVK